MMLNGPLKARSQAAVPISLNDSKYTDVELPDGFPESCESESPLILTGIEMT